MKKNRTRPHNIEAANPEIVREAEKRGFRYKIESGDGMTGPWWTVVEYVRDDTVEGGWRCTGGDRHWIMPDLAVVARSMYLMGFWTHGERVIR